LPSDRITHGNKAYDVLSVIDKGMGEYSVGIDVQVGRVGPQKALGVCMGVFV
jgi:hypothetical protein